MQSIVRIQFGSHMYGTNVATSDLDYKSIFIPRAEDILLQRVRHNISTTTKAVKDSRNSAHDVDTEAFALHEWMKLLLEGQTMALDMLFAPPDFVMETSPIWEEITSLKAHWLHSSMKPFIGYCRTQANKYGIKGSRIAAIRNALAFFEGKHNEYGAKTKLRAFWKEVESFAGACEFAETLTQYDGERNPTPLLSVCGKMVQDGNTIATALIIYGKMLEEYGTRAFQAERNEGIDWKALMHAVRVCEEAKELLQDHRITFPRPERELLLTIRQGEMDYKEVAAIIEAGFADLEALEKTTTLPPNPDRKAMDDFIAKHYRQAVLAA